MELRDKEHISIRDILDWFDKRKIPYQRGRGYIKILPNGTFKYYRHRYEIVKEDFLEKHGQEMYDKIFSCINIDYWFLGLRFQELIISLVGRKEKEIIKIGDFFIDKNKCISPWDIMSKVKVGKGNESK